MKKKKLMKVGIVLILLSGVAFAVMLLIPFLDMPNKIKVIGSSVSFVAMEILFWVGGLLVGKELFAKYKSYLNPKNWFNKTPNSDDTIE
ncbi:MAG: transporter suffix domain-containing protein [Salinivirgaceae bacterium]|nr:transporter suffix domain-containing protein [Salinivirgaceae bacterium]